jgi:hypothetical protein
VWLTRGSFALEIAAPLAAWSPLLSGPVRSLVVLAMVLFHLCGIGPTLRLGLFPWISAVAWFLFLPGWLWDRLGSGRLGALMARLDRADAGGEEARRRRLSEAARRGGMTAPPPAATPRTGASPPAVSGPATQAPPPAPAPAPAMVPWPARGRRLADLLAACLLVYVVLLNLREVAPGRFARLLPAATSVVEQALALHQRWNMFAPAPPTDDGWIVVVGRLAGGGTVDPWREAPVDRARPERFAAVYGNARWTKYLTDLRRPEFVFHRRLFGNYLCRRWNAAHGGDERLQGLALVYMLERTVPPDRELPAEPLLLFSQTCPAGGAGAAAAAGATAVP